jgi:5-methylcytosine-specific restriction endonuclease McrA
MGKPGKALSKKATTATISKAAQTTYARVVGRALGRIRDRIAERDGYKCRHCGRVTVEFEVDHIVPLYAGGPESDDNRQLLCVYCHRVKSDKEERERDNGRLP